jgi:hypothetical protein
MDCDSVNESEVRTKVRSSHILLCLASSSISSVGFVPPNHVSIATRQNERCASDYERVRLAI